MKKLLALMLAGVLTLTACSSGGGGESAAEPSDGAASGGESAAATEITVWAWDKNFNIKAMEIAGEEYAKENSNVKLDLIESAQEDIVQKLNTSLSSGTTKGLPNIVLIEDYRAPGFLQAYPDMFYDLTGKFAADEFAQYKLGPTSYEGKNYGIPFDTGVTGLFVRTDYLEQAGFTVEDLKDTDWDKFIEVGKAVKAATGKDMLTLDPSDLGIIRTMIQSAGSWFTKEDGVTPNLADNAALKASFETYKKIIEADISKPVSDWSQFLAGFNSGDVASVPTGNWITASVKQEASQSGKWAVVAQPRLPGMAESVNASNLGGSSWYVLNVDGKEAAAEFLAKTYGSNVGMYQRFITEIGAIGTYQPASSGDAYQTADEFFGGQQVLTDFTTWMEKIPQVNYGLHTYAISDILAVELQNYLQGKDLDQALADAQAQAEMQLK